ncbi:MAG: AMP-binding protein [bacterium]
MKGEITELTVPALLDKSFDFFAELPCLAFAGEEPLDFKTVAEKKIWLSAKLLSYNIQRGDKVSILGDNSPNWVIAYLAITDIGAVAVPILTGFPEADIRHIIRNSESKAVFITNNYVSKVEDLEESELGLIFSLEDFTEKHIKKVKQRKLDKDIMKFIKGDKINYDLKKLTVSFPKPVPDDLAAIIYTSGTTGHSKGVMLTHKNIASDVLNALKKFPLTPDDRFLSILPLAHTFEATGGMLCPLVAGVSIFYMKGLPTPKKLLAGMQTVKPTGVLTVPLVVDKIYRKKILPNIQSKKITAFLYKIFPFRKMLNKIAGKKLVSSLGGHLRFFMFGGASLNPDVENFLRDAKISYSTGYGLTETSPILTINPFGKVKVGSCGQAIPGVDIKIHNPDPETNVGEIIVNGPNIMYGYYKNPKATKEMFISDGWLKTGDLGYLDDDDYLYIKGRSKNVIVDASGENIYPEIIEQQLLQNPYIQQVIVFKKEGRLIAKVYPDYDILNEEFEFKNKDESETAALVKDVLENIRNEINQTLPAYSAISKIEEQPEPFEMTPTNKVKRYLYT